MAIIIGWKIKTESIRSRFLNDSGKPFSNAELELSAVVLGIIVVLILLQRNTNHQALEQLIKRNRRTIQRQNNQIVRTAGTLRGCTTTYSRQQVKTY